MNDELILRFDKNVEALAAQRALLREAAAVLEPLAELAEGCKHLAPFSEVRVSKELVLRAAALLEKMKREESSK